MDKRKWIAIGVAAAAIVIVLLLLILLRPKTADTDMVGLCYREKTTEANASERAALEALLKEKGLVVTIVDADEDQSKQLQQIGQLAQQGCDCLIVEPVMTDAAGDLLKALDATGLPAVLINREIHTSLLTAYSKITYIGTDSSAPGKHQAQMTLVLPDGGDINGDGMLSYMVLQGPEEHKDSAIRTQSLEDALADSPLEIHRLTTVNGDWTKESGKTLCSQELAEFGKDIEVIFCANDQMALGAIEAIQDGGRTVGQDVYLFAIGGETETLQSIDNGTLSGTAYTDPAAYQAAIVTAVLRGIQGQSAENVQIIPYISLTTENLSQYYKKS